MTDRLLASRMGCEAVELLTNGVANKIVCLQGNDICNIEIKYAQIMDKMCNNKIKPGDLDNIEQADIDAMRARVDLRIKQKKALYDMVDIISR